VTVWEFSKRVGIVAGAAIGVITLFGIAHKWAISSIEEQLRTEHDQRVSADEAQMESTSRLAKIVELQAVLNVEPPGSPDRMAAFRELRQMRRIGIGRP
jgi:hypothetical protein